MLFQEEGQLRLFDMDFSWIDFREVFSPTTSKYRELQNHNQYTKRALICIL